MLLSRLFVLPLVAAAAAAFSPEIHQTAQNVLSTQILYFDDAPVVLNLNENVLYRSHDSGKTWDASLEQIGQIFLDPLKKERAFAFTQGNTHYVTNDRGETWSTFTVPMTADIAYDININSVNHDHVIISYFDCSDTDGSCHASVYVTKDGFKSNPTQLVKNVEKCLFVKSNEAFTKGEDSRILCLQTERDSHGYVRRSRVIASNDFFKTEPQILNDASGVLAGAYVLDVRVVQTFVVAVVQDDKYDQTGSSVLLYVSKDGVDFSKAIMAEQLQANGFEFLASTKNSLHVAVYPVDQGFSSTSNVLSSDEDGIHFRNLLSGLGTSQILGFSNIDKVETIEGVWIAGVSEGYDQTTYLPLERSKITFDDGNTWQYLRTETCEGNEECGLNVLTVEERRGDGQGSTGATPGILMAIGNEGRSLNRDPFSLHTYVSRDGGWSWSKTLEEPCVFAFGDLGNVIVAAPFTKDKENLTSKKFYYSLDQATTWQTIELEDAVFPTLLTTAIDGTTSNFLFVGIQPKQDSMKQILFSLDFSKAFSRTCGPNDFEKWYGRSKGNNEGSCVFGHKDIYNRRKADADCFVNKAFEDLKYDEVPCTCTEADYECSFGFTLNSKGECAPDRAELLKLCTESTGNILNLKLKKKIGGNKCEGGDVEIQEVEFTCDDDLLKAQSITVQASSFDGHITNYYFMEQSEYGSNDETLFIKTSYNTVYISHDGGANFKLFESDDQILAIYLNTYFKDYVYLVGTNNKVYFSGNRGKNFRVMETPSEVNPFGLQVFVFDPLSADRFIFFGDEGCESQYSSKCKPIAFLTEDSGKSWTPLASGTKHCDFVGAKYIDRNNDERLIFCEVVDSNSHSLLSSVDKFATHEVVFEKVVGFASTTHFTVVASTDGESLRAFVTIDGKTFAEAKFPKDFDVHEQQAYTVLGSETGAIFLHVTSNERPGSEYGAILKSNINGTSYVMSERYVNRNEFGFVDYERVEGLDGIALINTVKNYDAAKGGAIKELQSRITFNDGSDWYFIAPPAKDSEGKKYPCIGSPLKECSLHLHGYTERKDFRDTYSSGSATGLLFGVGNVGDKLGSLNNASTFITRDAGATWTEVRKGVYQWEYGDRGSIVVLVDDVSETNVIHYSLDEGSTWNEYEFNDAKVKISDIVTVPSDTSKKFLLISEASGQGESSLTFTIDFEKVFTRQCVLDLDHPDDDDFEYWTPNHPLSSSKCLFGHEAKYLRKIPDRVNCFIGSAPLGKAKKIVKNCPCTRHDYECDYNYEKADDGTCKLIAGLVPEDRSEICRVDQNAIEYFQPTGYRKIAMSTCEGGQEFDKWDPVPCPGKEKEFSKSRAGKLGGFGLAMVIIIPTSVFAFAVWFVYDRGIRRNGGFARFGEIRLGDDDDLIENNNTDKVVNAVVRGGIAVLASVIATYKMIGLLGRGLGESIKGAFTRVSRYQTRGAGYRTVGVNDYRDDEDILGEVLNDDDYDIDDGDNDAHYDASEAYTDDRNLE